MVKNSDMIFDILVLVVLLISAGIAFMRGFIREVLTIAGVLGGLAAAYFGGPLLIPFMRGWLGVEQGVEPERLFGILPYDVLADILSYGLIFIIVVIVLSIISHTLAESARAIGLGAVDRTLGFIFGLVRGILLLGLLYLPVHLFVAQETKNDWFEGSRTHLYLEKTAEAMASVLPEETKEDAQKALEDGQEANTMREKLENIDLLRPDQEKLEGQPNAGGENREGYNDDFRSRMDELFEEKSRNLNE